MFPEFTFRKPKPPQLGVTSFREFVKNDLLRRLLDDVNDERIFNEADLQYRAAHHLDREYFPKLFLANQPTIPIGRGRATAPAKPDIVLYHPDYGPQTAIELKCFLKHETPTFSVIADAVWRDADKLRKFRARYEDSRNAFAIALVDVNKDLYLELRREFGATREEWMTHYLFVHVLNVFCDDNGRKRNWYNNWKQKMNEWKQFFADE